MRSEIRIGGILVTTNWYPYISDNLVTNNYMIIIYELFGASLTSLSEGNNMPGNITTNC